MDLRFTPEEQAFRAEVRAFIRDNLPAEIRLKVWRKASDRSVIIDLWTEYRKCEITNVIFYHQYYATKLADTYSRVLQVNRESRDEVSIHSF